ncbi:hypothetical protein BOX15_Mlig005103g1 [Macrostomum lignano]|uniref:BHLH domain-containing protein n=1 Tax=Macrostomum lignano TaxID=282301 RepID=A0A267EEF4_9PLAT|nr:hypothetical protein BOX15_Mlig005103g2 [Macrostomum lignano]PAA59247.1 hypothetical protein BOX15_Mlig005103g1 [Macrostomum lignano]
MEQQNSAELHVSSSGSLAGAGENLNRSMFNASLDSSLNCSPGGINPRRRESKSRAEKKRRDRINACFERMHQLLREEELKGGGVAADISTEFCLGGQQFSPGTEKAEILEQMIRFVEQLKRERRCQGPPPAAPAAALMDSKAAASTPDRLRPAAAEDSLIRSYLTGYKKGIQNIFILIDRLCHESERLTKAELVDKIKKGYLDNADSPAAIGREKLAALASAPAPSPISAPSAAASRPALGDLSNQHSATPPTPKKLSTTSLAAASATATAAAALIELSASPNPRSAPPPPMRQLQPPAKKRRAFREQPPPPEQPRYEPISPGPYEPTVIGDRCCLDDSGGVPTGDSLWRPW